MRVLINRFLKNEGGNFAIIFGLALVPIAASIGAGVDYSQMNNRKAKMQSAADTAIFAAARDAGNASQFGHLAKAYLEANLDGLDIEVDPKTGPKSVELTVTNRYETAFMGIVGVPELTISVNVELAIEKFGRGSTSGKGSGNNASGSRNNSDVRELERYREKLLQSVSGWPPREREEFRRQVNKRFDYLIERTKSGSNSQSVYLKK